MQYELVSGLFVLEAKGVYIEGNMSCTSKKRKHGKYCLWFFPEVNVILNLSLRALEMSQIHRNVHLVLVSFVAVFELCRGRYGVGKNGSSRIDNGHNSNKGIVNGKNGNDGIVNVKNGDGGVNVKNGDDSIVNGKSSDNGAVNGKTSDNGIVNGSGEREIMQLDVVGYKAAT